MMQCLCGSYGHKALQSLNAELLKALAEVTASLAWNAHGECRAIHDGPIMPSTGAVEMGKLLSPRPGAKHD